MIWGHVFGMHCLLREAVHGNAGKLAVLYHSVLCWAVAATAHTQSAALYLLNHTIPLHGLSTKQVIWYFGRLEGKRQHYIQAQDAGVEGYVQQPRWVSEFVHAALQEVENSSGGCHHPSHVPIARKKYHEAISAI